VTAWLLERVLAISEDVMFKWRLLVGQGRKAGHTFSHPDLIIAATAQHHGLYDRFTRHEGVRRRADRHVQSLDEFPSGANLTPGDAATTPSDRRESSSVIVTLPGTQLEKSIAIRALRSRIKNRGA